MSTVSSHTWADRFRDVIDREMSVPEIADGVGISDERDVPRLRQALAHAVDMGYIRRVRSGRYAPAFSEQETVSLSALRRASGAAGWAALDLGALPVGVSVDDLAGVLAALGFEVELRVRVRGGT